MSKSAPFPGTVREVEELRHENTVPWDSAATGAGEPTIPHKGPAVIALEQKHHPGANNGKNSEAAK